MERNSVDASKLCWRYWSWGRFLMERRLISAPCIALLLVHVAQISQLLLRLTRIGGLEGKPGGVGSIFFLAECLIGRIIRGRTPCVVWLAQEGSTRPGRQGWSTWHKVVPFIDIEPALCRLASLHLPLAAAERGDAKICFQADRYRQRRACGKSACLLCSMFLRGQSRLALPQFS